MRKLGVLALCCFGCSGACGGGGARVAPQPIAAIGSAGSAATPATTGALDDKMVASYWTTPDEQAGAAAFGSGDDAAALTSFTAARAAIPDAKDVRAGRIELMLGLVADRSGDHTGAAAHLLAARAVLPELSDFIGYHAARALWLAHDPTALEVAQSVAKDSIVGPDAEMVAGELSTDKATFYRDYLAHHPDGPFRSEARFDLATALAATDAAESQKLFRQITIDDPLSSWNDKARAQLANPAPLTPAEQITQAMVLFDNQRNPESEQAFATALADPAITPAEACVASYHHAMSRFKARDRKGAAPMFDDAVAACKKAGNTDLEISSEYDAGRSYAFIGQHETAIAHYKNAQTIDPKHHLADDALLREGEEWTSLNNDAQVEATLSAMPAQFPQGDVLAEAMWRLGFKAWRAQKYDDAIKWWKEQIRLVPHDPNWYGEGEPQYWIGRAFAAKNQLPDAIASWQSAVREYPLSYYSLLALNRLQEMAPQPYQQLLAEISKDDKPAPLDFPARPEWSTPGFQRALELLRLGLGEPAAHELRKLGLAPPDGRKPVTDPDQQNKLGAIAFLYDRADRWSASVAMMRWNLPDWYRRQWPLGANRAKWLLAYPRGYLEILTRHAALNHVPLAMQVAIVREESGFDPLDESYANAIGLTQMIPDTAHDFSKGTGIDPTRENLRDPEKNVTIGSRFLGSLFKDWHDYSLLVPASYNGGPGYVRRMLRARGTWDADEFVEAIGADEDRNYTKRVIASFFTYSWLYDHKVPTIPNKIPADLIPKSK
ncbi:MAG TPA: transglycosylase SLT domain-containing protein [Kofleriaceae bacterium]|jgi:soluble lytic murein transglycosylase